MLKHKRTLAGILAATMMLSMAACGSGGSSNGGDSNAAEGPQDPNAAAAAGTLELTDWEKSSGIFNTDETDEELYEKAKEEGKVTVYSISSRITKVANASLRSTPASRLSRSISPPTSCSRRSPVSTTQASTLPTLSISRTRTVRSTTSISPPASSTTTSRLTSCPISTRSSPRPRLRSTSS